MRVIGGCWRGRRLVAPAGRGTRPTSDKVREAVFDVLSSLVLAGRLCPASGSQDDEAAAGRAEGGLLVGCRVVDLYAGSGAVGIESLSRGAACCTFVESERPALRALRENLVGLDVPPDRAKVTSRRVSVALRDEEAAGNRYTLLFADPPYEEYRGEERWVALAATSLLEGSGVAVVETAADVVPELPLGVLSAKTYGDTRVTFLCVGGCRSQPSEE